MLRVSLIFGVFLQTISIVRGSPASLCGVKDDGNYPDPNDCRGFISCSNHITHHMQCPSDLKWNDREKRCDWPQNAYPACGVSSNSAPSYSCKQQIISNNFCSGKANGNYPDPSNCHGYIACSNDLLYHMPCPAKLKWNDRQKRCDWAKNAFPACSGATPPPTIAPTTNSVGVGGNFCQKKANGNYPDPQNCFGYIACSNGLTYHMPCPASLKWNDNKKRCDWPKHANPGCSGAHQWPCYICVCPNGNCQSNFCSNKVNGNYPDPNHCHGYIACSNGITYHMPCPAGLVWNNVQKMCDWKRNVPPPCGTLTLITSSSTPGPVTTPASNSFTCAGKTNGNYPDPKNCHGYIACSNGIKYHMPCPAELKWNDRQKRCDWPKYAYPACGASSSSGPSYTCKVQVISNNFCSGKANGNYPDPSNCHGYIACSNDLLYHMPCPAKLKWNDRQKRCDWAKNAFPACSGATPPPTIAPTTNSVGVGGNFCQKKANGNYPDPQNCFGYIACSNGLTYHMPCPASLKWNDNKKRCDWPKHANPGCSGAHQWPCYICVCPNGNCQSNFCSNKVNGNYPDPNHCHGYIACSNGITYHMPCPAGLVWNNVQKMCDWKRNVPPPCGTLTLITSSPTPGPVTTPASNSFTCVGKTNGNYPDPDNCHGYIACSNGIKYRMPCPAGLVWNNVNKRCDWKRNVPPPCGILFVIPTLPPINFCTGKPDGNYPDPSNIYGYITCSNGVPTRVQCPGNLKWNAAKKMCDWLQGDGFCNDKANGNYHDHDNCYGYIACSNGITYHMPCPAGLMWNNNKKLCDWPRHATGNGCQAAGCSDILSVECCDVIQARNDCGGVVGFYCRKTCKRC